MLLCGDQVTIADYFGACLMVLGETIEADYSAILCQEMARQYGEAAHLAESN